MQHQDNELLNALIFDFESNLDLTYALQMDSNGSKIWNQYTPSSIKLKKYSDDFAERIKKHARRFFADSAFTEVGSKKSKDMHEERFYELLQLIRQQKKNNLTHESYAHCFYFAVKIQKYAEAKEIYDEMGRKGIIDLRDRVVYMELCSKTNQNLKSEQCFQTYFSKLDLSKSENCAVYYKACSALLFCYISQGREKLKKAHEFYQPLKSLNDFYPHYAMVHVYSIQNNINETVAAIKKLEELQAKGYKINFIPYIALLEVYFYNFGHYKDFLPLFYEKMSLLPRNRVHIGLEFLIMLGFYREAERVANFLNQYEDLVNVNYTLAGMYLENRQFDKASAVLKPYVSPQDMRSSARQLEILSYHKKFAEAGKLIKDIEKCMQQPEKPAWTLAKLKSYALQERYSKVDRIYAKTSNKTSIINNMMLSVLYSQGRYQEAEALFKNLHLSQDPSACAIIISCLIDQQKFKEIDQLYAEMKNSNSTLCNAYLRSLLARKDYDRANSFYAEMGNKFTFATEHTSHETVKISFQTHMIMLENHLERKNYAKARELYETRRCDAIFNVQYLSDIIPDLQKLNKAIYNDKKSFTAWELYRKALYIQLLIGENNLKEAEREIHHLPNLIAEEEKLPPALLNAVLLFYATKEDAVFETLFTKHIDQVNPETLLLKLQFLCKRKQYDEAIACFRSLSTHADVRAYHLIIEVCLMQGYYQIALEIYNDISSNADKHCALYRKPNIKIFNAGIKLFLLQDKEEEAKALYYRVKSMGDETTERLAKLLGITAKKTEVKEEVEKTEELEKIETIEDKQPSAEKGKQKTPADVYIPPHKQSAQYQASSQKNNKAVKYNKRYFDRHSDAIYDVMFDMRNALKNEDFATVETLYKQNEAANNRMLENILLRAYYQQGKFTELETIINNKGQDFDSHHLLLLLQAKHKQGKLDEAIALYQQIDFSPNIYVNTFMLKVYGAAKREEECHALFEKLKPYRNAVVYSTMFNYLVESKQHEKAEMLYKEIESDTALANPAYNQTTRIKAFARQHDLAKAEVVFGEIENKNLVNFHTLIRYEIRYFEFPAIDKICNLLEEAEKHLDAIPPHLSIYLKELTKFAMHWHELASNVAPRIKKSAAYAKVHEKAIAKTKKFLALAIHQLEKSETKKNRITISLAQLLARYYPEKDFTPAYEKLTEAELERLQKEAIKQLPDQPKAFTSTMKYVIPVVDQHGNKIAEHQLNHSIYHMLTNGKFPSYLIVKFTKALKPHKIPLFIYFEGNIYRTDLFGGSRLKTKMVAGQFDCGGLIAIPLAACDFFDRYAPFKEMLAYFQRAFTADNKEGLTKGIEGPLRLAVLPLNEEKPFIPSAHYPYVLGDGFGFIRQSLAKKLDLPHLSAPLTPTNTLSFMALQCYSPDKTVAKEIAEVLRPEIIKIKKDLANGIHHPNTLYRLLSGSLPKISGVALPVAGDKLILPDTPAFRKLAEHGLIIGRNPYDSKLLQVFEPDNISFSGAMNGPVFQYSLAGVTENNVGEFYKGLLCAIPDEYWPKDFKKTDIIVCKDDLKLSQEWQKPEDKELAKKNPETQLYTLHGSIVVTETFSDKCIGVPLPRMKKMEGDYDGDTVDAVKATNLAATKEKIAREQASQIINHKVPKTMRPRVGKSNLEQILTIKYAGLVEQWTAILNVYDYLQPKERQLLADQLVENHLLVDIYGEKWKEKCGLGNNYCDNESIVRAEIQLGIKFGEDAAKTTVPLDLLKPRAREYQKALLTFVKKLTVPYGKSFNKDLARTPVEDFGDKAKLMTLFSPIFGSPRAPNLISKVQRGVTRFFRDCELPKMATADMDGYISDDEAETPSLQETYNICAIV